MTGIGLRVLATLGPRDLMEVTGEVQKLTPISSLTVVIGQYPPPPQQSGIAPLRLPSASFQPRLRRKMRNPKRSTNTQVGFMFHGRVGSGSSRCRWEAGGGEGCVSSGVREEGRQSCVAPAKRLAVDILGI